MAFLLGESRKTGNVPVAKPMPSLRSVCIAVRELFLRIVHPWMILHTEILSNVSFTVNILVPTNFLFV